MADPDPLDELPPALANAKNRELNEQVNTNRRVLVKIEKDLDDNHDRIKVMTSHLKSVEQELRSHQDLVAAKNKESETEEHMKRLSEREIGRIQIEMKKHSKLKEEINSQMNILRNSIFHGEKKIADFKAQMQNQQVDYDAWLVASKQKEEDNLLLEKHRRADDSRQRDLTLALEKIAREVQETKRRLEVEITETQAAQIELDKTQEEFKTQHRERQQLIQQWKDALAAMGRRDSEIEKTEETLGSVKVQLQERELLIDEKKKFLTAEEANNVQADSKISNNDRNVGRLRMALTSMRQEVGEFGDQVETLKGQVQATSAKLFAARGEVGLLRTGIDEKKVKIEQLKESRAKAEDGKRALATRTLTMEQKMTNLEEMLRAEEYRSKEVTKALQDIKELLFRESQDLFKARTSEANLIAEINGAQASKRHLHANIQRLDGEATKQQELIYNQEFQLQQLERKVSRAQGERSDEEKQLLMQRIEQLQGQLEEQTKVTTLLSGQHKKLQDDVRRSNRKLQVGEKELQSLKSQINELDLENASAERIVKAATEEKEQLMVKANLLKLDVNKLRDVLRLRADEVFGLGNRKEQLRLSLEERIAEIGAHIDVLRARMKAAEEERHKARQELRDRQQKVEKLEAKYNTMNIKFAVGDGEEEHSQAYFVIKAAQEREELLREGDEVNAKIAKAEREIKALENTMVHLCDNNKELQTMLRKADATGDEMEEKHQKQEIHRAVTDKYKHKQREIAEMREEQQAIEQALIDWEHQEAGAMQEVSDVETQKAALEKTVAHQMEQIGRARAKVNQMSARLQKGTGVETFEEKDFEVKELSAANKKLLQKLREVSDRVPELREEIQQRLAHHSIQLPTEDGPGGGRLDSSDAGSVRSAGSARSVGSAASRGSRASAKIATVAPTLPARAVPPVPSPARPSPATRPPGTKAPPRTGSGRGSATPSPASSRGSSRRSSVSSQRSVTSATNLSITGTPKKS